MRALILALLLAAPLAGCEDEPSDQPPPGTPQPSACPDGKAQRDDGTCGWLAADTCPAGTRAAIGSADCVPVGWRDCTDGFGPDPTGWGCTDVLPPSACAGATRAALGSATCTPVGDCTAPFPPPEATLFVDDNGPTDATHFNAIIDAVAAAPSGATIAVAPGTYHESVELSRPVRIVGRCAAQVVIDVNGQAYPALQVVSGAAEVRGVTLRRGHPGVSMVGGSLALHDAVVEQSTLFGVVVKGAGTRLVARDVAVRGVSADPTAGSGWGGYVFDGASADLSGVTVSGSVEAGLGAFDSTLALAQTAILDTRPNAQGKLGHGLEAQDSPVTADGLVVASATGLGVQLVGAKTVAQLSRVVVRDVAAYSDAEGGRGITVAEGARLTLTDAAVHGADEVGLRVGGSLKPSSSAVLERVVIRDLRGNTVPQAQPGMKQYLGWGANVVQGSKLELRDSAIVGVTELGVGVFDASSALLFDHSLLASTHPNPDGLLGRGIAVLLGGVARVADSTLASTREVALECQSDTSVLTVSRTLVRDVALSASPSGHGLVANFCGRTDVQDSRIEQAPGAAIAYAGTAGLVSGTEVRAGGIGVHTQGGSVARVVDAPEEPVGAEVVVTSDCRFEGVATTVSGKDLPLPAPVVPTR